MTFLPMFAKDYIVLSCHITICFTKSYIMRRISDDYDTC